MLKVNFAGNLTSDPELSSKVDCCNINVATRTSKIVDGQPKTEFVRASVWGKRGQACAQHLHKGDYVIGVGDLEINEYVGRDNEKHISLNILNADIEFGPKRSNSYSNSAGNDEDDEDLLD